MPSISTIFAGIAVALALALAGTGYMLKRSWQAEATAQAALSTALEANASLITERDTAKREAERNQAISAAAIRDTADLNAKVAAIKERLRNGQACLVDPADADALDGLFR